MQKSRLKKSRREKTGNLRENANLWSTPRARDWKDTYRPSSERSDLPIQIFNNGNMIRDFTYIDDIVEAIIRIHDKKAETDSTFFNLTFL